MVYVQSAYMFDTISYDETMLFYVSDNRIVKPVLRENRIHASDIASYQKYLLNEKILTDWFQANQGKSSYSMENWGAYTELDSTYAKLGDNWA